MNEDRFNMSVRKFLKMVGVTSQREIENAIHEAVKAGGLRGDETIRAAYSDGCQPGLPTQSSR